MRLGTRFVSLSFRAVLPSRSSAMKTGRAAGGVPREPQPPTREQESRGRVHRASYATMPRGRHLRREAAE
jgi:hypothetical protein